MSAKARKRLNAVMRDRRKSEARIAPGRTPLERELTDAYHAGDPDRFHRLMQSRRLPTDGVGMALVLAAGIFDDEPDEAQ